MKRRAFLKSAAALPAGLEMFTFGQQAVSQSGPADLLISPPGNNRAEGTGPWTFKVTAADSGGRYSLMESGAIAPPVHVHHSLDEWWYVLQGEFGFQVGGQKVRLGAGGSVLGPRGLPHGFVNLGSTPGKLLIMYDPAATMEAVFREYAQLIANGRQPTSDEVTALARKYNIDNVGPPLVKSDFDAVR